MNDLVKVEKRNQNIIGHLFRFILKMIPWAIIAGIVCVSSYVIYLHPRVISWGAIKAEVNESLPYDELVPNAEVSMTRGITINAPVEKVWPWLIQFGYKRAGMYSYDYLDKLMGCANYVDGDKSSNRIVPELQNLKIGDRIYLNNFLFYTVAELEPDSVLALKIGDEKTSQGSWVFILKRVDKNTTRMIIRTRNHDAAIMNKIINNVLEPGKFIMERKMYLGIKERAEKYK